MEGSAREAEAGGLELAQQLKRVLGLYRLYGTRHGLAREAEEQVVVVLGRHPELTLLVDAQGLRCGGLRVLEEGKKEESLTRPLFAEGVEALTFHDPVDREELADLLHIWFFALTRGLDAEHTFATMVWERDLRTITTTLRAGLVDQPGDTADAAARGRVSKLLASLTAEAPRSSGPRRPLDVEALAALSRVEGLAKLGRAELDQAADAERASLAGLGKTDRSALLAALHGESRGVGQRSLLAVWHAAREAEPEERQALFDFGGRIVGTLLAEGRPGEVARALLRASEQDGAAAGPLLAVLGEPAVLASLLALLEDRGKSQDALALLGYLPEGQLGALVRSIPQPGPEARSRLPAVIAAKRPAAETLVGLLLLEARALPVLLDAAERLSSEHVDLLLRAALTHDEAAVRRSALERLRTVQVDSLRSLLVRAAEDQDPLVRQAALAVLLRAKEPLACELLARQLARADAPLEERRTALRGLGAVGGPRAFEILAETLLASDRRELRKAAALALGLVNDPRARELLAGEARRLLGDPGVKEACREALRRMEAKGE